MGASETVAGWAARFIGDPSLAQKLKGRVKFMVRGSGGGIWVLDCRGAPRLIEEDVEADCVLALSAEDLMQIAAGSLNPQSAFVQGRLEVRGDMGLALKFSSLLFSD